MKRSVLPLLGILLVALGLLTIGIFNPEIRISTDLTVSRSEAASFHVLSSPSNVSNWIEGIGRQEALVEHPERVGNTYRLTHTDGTEWEASIEDLEDNTRIVMTLKDSRAEMRVEAEVFPSSGGTRVHFETTIRGTTIFYRTLMPFVKGNISKSQSRINQNWVTLIESATESLVGAWSGRDASGSEQLFEFRTDGTLDWKVSSDAGVFQLINLLYLRNEKVHPETLNLSGFESGPLAGLTLYGLIDLSRPDTLIFDAEAGNSDDPSVRPTGFTDSAVTYIRVY